jgi:hypothetical protein
VHVWLQNFVHNLLYLVVKMVDEVEKVNLLLLLHLLLNLCWIFAECSKSAAAAKSAARSSAECLESAARSSLNVRNLLLLLNATENV